MSALAFPPAASIFSFAVAVNLLACTVSFGQFSVARILTPSDILDAVLDQFHGDTVMPSSKISRRSTLMATYSMRKDCGSHTGDAPGQGIWPPSKPGRLPPPNGLWHPCGPCQVAQRNRTAKPLGGSGQPNTGTVHEVSSLTELLVRASTSTMCLTRRSARISGVVP